MARLRPGRIAVVAALALVLVASACRSKDDSSSSDRAGAAPECLTLADLYALIGPESEGFTNWSDAQELASSLGSDTQVPDAELTITGPGEESGTYGSFIDLAIKPTGETQAEAGTITEDQIETTRKDYDSNADDNVIIDGVAGADASLGWVGFAYAEENGDSVREIKVDGGDGCVAPGQATIEDGSYPLSRPLFISVNLDKANENPAVAAFVDYYLSDASEAAVSDAGYIELPASEWKATQDAWAAEGITGPSGSVSGDVHVSGSSTVEPISALQAQNFKEANPDLSIDVKGPGTSDGLKQFCAGEIDIVDQSREFKDEEIALCKDAGVNYIQLKIGLDGITIITKK